MLHKATRTLPKKPGSVNTARSWAPVAQFVTACNRNAAGTTAAVTALLWASNNQGIIRAGRCSNLNASGGKLPLCTVQTTLTCEGEQPLWFARLSLALAAHLLFCGVGASILLLGLKYVVLLSSSFANSGRGSRLEGMPCIWAALLATKPYGHAPSATFAHCELPVSRTK